MKYIGKTNEHFEIINVTKDNQKIIEEAQEGFLTVVWFTDDNNSFVIDSKHYQFQQDQIICLTSFHKVEVKSLSSAKFLRFNSPFYCILDHDSEISCKGILFFGSTNLPLLNPSEEDLNILNTVWKMIIIEMNSKDNLQLEMLQMMLKRLLILFTRIYKSQDNFHALDANQVDIVREFNYLVEQNFREKHSVSEYASLLNKSPKTLSNLFRKIHDKSPLQLIQNRIMLEVRRLLRHSDLPVSEIGYSVGFNDVQSFSRFFKKNEGVSPSEFRNN